MSKGKCELCGVDCDLTAHHLVPRHVCRSSKYSKDLKTDDSNIIMICRQCHDFIHAKWDDQTLRDMYSTKDELLNNDEMKKFILWRQKHPSFSGSAKMSNSRKNRFK